MAHFQHLSHSYICVILPSPSFHGLNHLRMLHFIISSIKLIPYSIQNLPYTCSLLLLSHSPVKYLFSQHESYTFEFCSMSKYYLHIQLLELASSEVHLFYLHVQCPSFICHDSTTFLYCSFLSIHISILGWKIFKTHSLLHSS